MTTAITIQNFLGMAIVGFGVSLLIETIQAKFGTGSLTTKWLAIIMSVAVGGIYVWLQSTVWWSTILTVLGAASTTYALFFNKTKKPSVTSTNQLG